jgi:uncharacterized repeat protein (TIGR01451 family)
MRTFCILSFCLLILTVGCKTISTTVTTTPPGLEAGFDVVIDHQTGIQNPSGLLKKNAGELVNVKVKNTSLACFYFTQTEQSSQTSHTLAFTDQVTWSIVHDGTPKDYTITPHLRTGAPAECQGMRTDPWVIRVSTDDWTIGFAGAFTADRITDPVYSLIPATQKDAAGNSVSGFTITRRKDLEDREHLGTAAMIHLYHSDDRRFALWHINWAPVSFAVATGDSGQTRYYLGTGFRFSDKLFLTAGFVGGPQKRLNDKFTSGGFTTDSTAINTLGTRMTVAPFLSLSYSFIGVGPTRFQGMFTQAAPAPSGASTAPSGSSATKADIGVTFSLPSGVKAGQPFKYTVTITNAGPADASNVTFNHTMPTQISSASWSCGATGATCKDASHSAPVTAISQTGLTITKSGFVTYTITGTVGASGTFDVVATAKHADAVTDPNPSDNEAVKATATIVP